MGYRNEIYRAATPIVEPLGSFCTPASMPDWKARGWRAFDGLNHPEQSATRADAKDSSILGLSYSLHSCHEAAQEKIMLRIDSWCYDKQGETTDLPVMELVFDAGKFSSPAKALELLKIMARPVALTEKIATRAVNAALFLIHQVNTHQVPDFERVLEMHRVHPDLNRDTDKIIKNTRPQAVSSKMRLSGTAGGLKGVNDSGAGER